MHDTTVEENALKQQLLESGHAAFDAGDYLRALDSYHRAALLDSRDCTVWTALGLTFSNLDFTREAWRSYLLALHMERTNLEALWYTSEFLFQIEDLPLADLFLGQYLELESDAQKLLDAQQLRAEVRAEAEARGIRLDTQRTGEAEAVLEGEHQAEVGDQLDQAGQAAGSEADDPEPLQLSEEELEAEALGAGDRFIPPLTLRLSGFESTCDNCGLQIPHDAPYCWSCKMIHFYE